MAASEFADRYYRPSGRVPFTGTLVMLVLGVAGAFVLAPLYAVADYHATYDKLRLLATMGYAGLIGGWVYQCSRFGKVRSRLFAGIVGFAIGLAALYFAWTWFLCLLSGWQFQVLLVDPVNLWGIVGDLAQAGIWTRNGMPVGATEQSLWWAAEALGIVFTTTAIAALPTRPFCEACHAWTRKSVTHTFAPPTTPDLKVELEQERYESFEELLRRPAAENVVATATVYSCPRCDESHYLDLGVVINPGGENAGGYGIVRQLWIPSEVVERIRNPGVMIETPPETTDAIEEQQPA